MSDDISIDIYGFLIMDRMKQDEVAGVFLLKLIKYIYI